MTMPMSENLYNLYEDFGVRWSNFEQLSKLSVIVNSFCNIVESMTIDE